MKITRNITALIAVAALVTLALPAEAGGPVHLLAPAASDLAARELVVPVETKAAPPVSHDTVTFAWPLDAGTTIDLAPAPHVAASREYWQRVSAAELRAGVTLYTTAPGALVRLNPVRQALTDELVAIDPHSLTIAAPGGRKLRDAEGMSQLATADELAQAGVPFPAATSAFRLSERLGAGEFVLQAPELPEDATATYVINVFDKASPAELRLQALRDVVFTGEALQARAELTDGGTVLPVEEVRAELVSPDGEVMPLEASVGADGAVTITGTLARRELAGPGLWEIHTSAVGRMGDLTVRRDARTAFSYAVPTARLTGDAEVTASPAGLKIAVGVEAAAPGRYEVRAVLFGTGDDGQLHPAVRADAATWLEPGTGAVPLEIDGATLAASGLKPPFELRDLRLMDQGRMFVLHRQARAAVLHRDLLAGLRTTETALH